MQKLFILLVLFLSACTKYEASSLQAVATTNVQNISGMEIYQKDCVACHGADGTGAFAGIPDLTQLAGFKKGADSENALFQHIEHVKNGKKTPGKPISMPAKGGDLSLSDADIKDVLKYMHDKFTAE
jgi:cytochrome c5